MSMSPRMIRSGIVYEPPTDGVIGVRLTQLRSSPSFRPLAFLAGSCEQYHACSRRRLHHSPGHEPPWPHVLLPRIQYQHPDSATPMSHSIHEPQWIGRPLTPVTKLAQSQQYVSEKLTVSASIQFAGLNVPLAIALSRKSTLQATRITGMDAPQMERTSSIH